MTYTDIVETRGAYRAVITLDESPHRPDGDFFGTVVWLDDRGRHTEVLAHAYGQDAAAERFASALDYAWNHFRDMELVSRYLRICFDVMDVDYFDTDDAKFVNVVTRADLVMWGWDPDDRASWPQHDDGTPYRPTENNLDETRAWADGDVWGISVEKCVTWTTDDAELDDQNTWEELPDSAVWGHFGEKYAREAALDALEEYAPTE